MVGGFVSNVVPYVIAVIAGIVGTLVAKAGDKDDENLFNWQIVNLTLYSVVVLILIPVITFILGAVIFIFLPSMGTFIASLPVNYLFEHPSLSSIVITYFAVLLASFIFISIMR